MNETKRIGRPARAPGERHKLLTVSLPPDIVAALRHHAERSERTVSRTALMLLRSIPLDEWPRLLGAPVVDEGEDY